MNVFLSPQVSFCDYNCRQRSPTGSFDARKLALISQKFTDDVVRGLFGILILWGHFSRWVEKMNTFEKKWDLKMQLFLIFGFAASTAPTLTRFLQWPMSSCNHYFTRIHKLTKYYLRDLVMNFRLCVPLTNTQPYIGTHRSYI